MEGGLYVAFGVCGIFFVVALAAILWAFKNGEFEDLESTKFDMMDDDLDGAKAARARALVERARLNNSAST
jgi:nitrogen fixation-related uncharacterized protein